MLIIDIVVALLIFYFIIHIDAGAWHLLRLIAVGLFKLALLMAVIFGALYFLKGLH